MMGFEVGKLGLEAGRLGADLGGEGALQSRNLVEPLANLGQPEAGFSHGSPPRSSGWMWVDLVPLPFASSAAPVRGVKDLPADAGPNGGGSTPRDGGSSCSVAVVGQGANA